MKKYKIIYADPPWKYDGRGCKGTPSNHYKIMDIEDISVLPISDISDNNSILFLWATYPKIKEALYIIDQWGFRYRSIAFQYIKLNNRNMKPFYGMGYWTRGNTEPCLLATRGKPKRISKSVSQLILSPIRRHSEKPPEVRTRILQLMGDLPRIELFARTHPEGWDVWGNEAPGSICLPIKLLDTI